MATRKPRKTKAAAEAPPPPYQCKKCGHAEGARQLRVIKVTLGWQRAQFAAVAPATMCTKCGDLTCTANIVIGDLAGVVPEAEANAATRTPRTTQTADQIDDAIRSLQEMKAGLKSGKVPAKGKTKAAKKKKATKKKGPRKRK